MSKEIRKQLNKIRKFSKIINENANSELIAYHISEYDFDKFKSSEHIGNFATLLDANYFLSTKKDLYNFGFTGIIYTVKIKPKHLFEFDLKTKNHWYLSLEFQELFSESLAGISNYLDDFLESQNVSASEVDCISLTNLEYLDDKKTKEYIVLDSDIIKILKKEKIK